MANNPVCFWELASHDAEKTTQFLEAVFDWKAEWNSRIGIYEFEAGADAGAFSGGGVFTLRRAKLPFLTIYIRVDDIEARAEKVVQHGGFIVEPVHELPGGSKICLFNEPSGVTLAMLQLALKT